VWPVDGAVAVVTGELMALVPDPPTPPRRSHKLTEPRQKRLSRWRFDQMIAATALVSWNVRLEGLGRTCPGGDKNQVTDDVAACSHCGRIPS